MSVPLNVIALISGGKDSFLSLLHCLANNHHIIALANLYPPPSTLFAGEADDLNSYMYQTVGHTILPLYSTAFALPLYRQQLSGSALNAEKDYSHSSIEDPNGDAEDETESLLPLLRKVLAAHPEANALSTGAILSTYQRTRIESVALRLGLVPLSYLWQYPSLPTPTPSSAGLLRDMAAVGVDARIIKVASGGLDESFLWENVCEERVIKRLERAVARFGGSVLGEGGEFETLVLNGPEGVWRGRIEVDERERNIRRGGGGEAWLELGLGKVVMHDRNSAKAEVSWKERLKMPELWDSRFEELLAIPSEVKVEAAIEIDSCSSAPWQAKQSVRESHKILKISNMTFPIPMSSIEEQMARISTELIQILSARNRSTSDIVFTTILLRSMSDFSSLNAIYGKLFTQPNPPARVTVACGDTLPEHAAVMLSFIVDLSFREHRKGLHVQSRSYWAPANIGPYSQAISVNTMKEASLVHIAGQIPLVPSSMEVLQADPQEDAMSLFHRQAALSLQHLWRIGIGTDVTWWTGAIAFVAGGNAKEKAMTAWSLWRHIHQVPTEDENEEDGDGPDAWDRKYGAVSSHFSVTEPTQRPLPDFGNAHAGDGDYVPGFFAVEIDELPRGCEVEWQSLGSAESGVSMESCVIRGFYGRRCTQVGSGHAVTFLAIPARGSDVSTVAESVSASLATLEQDAASMADGSQITVYTPRPGPFVEYGVQVIPCRRVWGSDGLELIAGLAMHSL